jgi:hypothetical protein
MIFLSETFFPYFFHVHLSILDKVVSSLYAIFGTRCIWMGFSQTVFSLASLLVYKSLTKNEKGEFL